MQEWFNINRPFNAINNINKMRSENYMIYSKDVEKALEKLNNYLW